MTSTADHHTVQQAGDIWKFLDTMSLSNPEQYKKFVNKVLKEGSDNNMGPPIAKLAIQTEKVPSVIPVRKYYINIAEWKQIPAPKEASSPVSIASSDPRKEIIEKEWAIVIDVVINPVIFQTNSKNYIENTHIIELILKYIESKHLFTLSRKYLFLSEKYKGNQDNLLNFMCPSALKNSINTLVSGNDIELTSKSISGENYLMSDDTNSTLIVGNSSRLNDEKPKVEKNSFKSSNEAKKHVDGKLKEKNKNDKVSPFDPIISGITSNSTVLKEMKTKRLNDGLKVKSKLTRPHVEMIVNKDDIELTIPLPRVASVQECDLTVKQESLSLFVADKYELNLNLPIDINDDGVKAKFIKDQRILLVTAPILRKI